MEKSSDAFRSIGEMAKELGVKTHILRYWEEQFPMLRPLKRAGGRRHYRAEDVAMLHKIHNLLHKQGYTIKGAAQYLAAGKTGEDTVSEHYVVPAATSSNPQFDHAALRAVRDRLVSALAAA
jgi:DNA-binding transcriptional MerR regulator